MHGGRRRLAVRYVAGFERGARAAASLAGPGVAVIYDTGTDDATRFIVMECVTGRGLSEILGSAPGTPPALGDQAPGQAGDRQEGVPPGKAKKHGELPKAPKGG